MGNAQPQLEMIWPKSLLDRPPIHALGPSTPCIFDPDRDLAEYLSLVHEAGFTSFRRTARDRLPPTCSAGWLLCGSPYAHERARGYSDGDPQLAPTTPLWWRVGMGGRRSAHSGKGLGEAVCSAVVARFLSAGYRRIFLLTDDWRLPALKVYLKLIRTATLRGTDSRKVAKPPATRWDGPTHRTPSRGKPRLKGTADG